MFNEELKKKFIIETTTSISVIESYKYMFKSIEKYELKYNSDVCTMNKDIVQNILENISGIRSVGSNNITTMLRNYIRWCLENNVDGAIADGLDARPSCILKIKSKMASTPIDFQNFLNSIYKREDEKTYDNVLRSFMWFAYSGIDAEDALSLTNDNICFDDMTIRKDGKEFVIYREGIKAIRNCFDLDFFFDGHENYKEGIILNRYDSNLLLRGIKANPEIKQISVNISKKNRAAIESGKTSRRISYDRAKSSGMFYRAYEMEISGFEVSFEKEIDGFLNGRTYKTDVNKRSAATTKRYLIKQYYEDYQNWKAAFNL